MNMTSSSRVARSNRTRLALLGALLPLITTTSAPATIYYWNFQSGNYNAAANWSTSPTSTVNPAMPGASDTANIWISSASTNTAFLNANTTIGTLNLSNPGTGTNTLAQQSFNLTAVNESLGGRGNGNGTHGALTQAGGTNTVSGFLAIGDVASSAGNYSMTGGTLNLNGASSGAGFYLGNSGTGTFTQSGSSAVTIGSVSTPVSSYLGYNSGATGTYNMNGGSLTTAGTMVVGYSGAGVFNQTGGTATIGGDLQVANTHNGSSGSVTVGPNATLTVNGQNTILGGSVPGTDYGPGSLTVQGSVTLNNLYINQSGALHLVAGGTLTVDNLIRRPPNSTFNWTGGTLNIPSVSITHANDAANFGPFYGAASLDNNVTFNIGSYLGVGDVGGYLGEFTQNAGAVTIGNAVTKAGSLALGVYHSAAGNYTLNNSGSLNVYGSVNIGSGSLKVNGGTMTVSGTINTTDLAAVAVGGGSLSLGGGYASNTKLNQSGGTISIAGALTLQSGGFDQSGGTATVGNGLTILGANVVNVAGSTTALNVTGSTGLGTAGLYSGLNISNGGTFKTTSVLNSTWNTDLNVAGTFNAGSLQLAGNFKQTGGAITVSGATGLNGTGFVQSAGTAALNGAINLYNGGHIDISGTGQLTTNGVVTLGNTNTAGHVNVFGGSMTVNNSLVSVYTSADVEVSGGTLTANHLYYAGPVTVTGGALNAGQSRSDGGILTVSGGTATIGTEFDLPGGGGVIVNGTGALKVNGDMYVGGNSTSIGGSSNLTVSGGSATITGALVDRVGPVQLSGGSLTANSFTVGGTYTQTGGTLTTPSLLVGNGATVALNGGTTHISGGTVSVLNGGTLSGVATINSPATINGNVRPGTDAAVGILNLSGANTFGATSNTRLRIAGFNLTDHLNTGTATLGGTLQLSMLNGYVPVYGNAYIVMTGNSIQGKFSKVAGAQLADRWLAVTYTSTYVAVTAAFGGDANLDGAVDFNDLVSLAQHYDLTTGQTWSTGDFNGTGGVDFNDLVILAQSYNQSLPANVALPSSFAADWAMAQSLVPEPTTAFAGFVSLVVLARRRQG